MLKNLKLRAITQADCQIISEAFQVQGWKDKTIAQYERYLAVQENGERDIIIAEFNQAFAGYLTILWKPHYPPFLEKGIPEIVDFMS
ncbi:MAG: hypothetical protein Sapg2KO_48560 [Saprospiraceae bacterium]